MATSKVQEKGLIYSWGGISVLTAFTTIYFAVSAQMEVEDDLGSLLILAWYFHSLFFWAILAWEMVTVNKNTAFPTMANPMQTTSRWISYFPEAAMRTE